MNLSSLQDPADTTGVVPSAQHQRRPSSADAPAPGQGLDAPSEGRISFADLGLHPTLVQRLADGGYEAPTPIQQQAIPPLLEGRDVIGQAQTGTGKTAAFALPMIQRLDVKQRKVQGLVLCPTRELAMQVTAALSSYGESRRVRVLTVYGGAPIHNQIAQLRNGVHVVVGTPGRIKDCMARGALSLASVRHLVLDEADEMLRMGFIEDVEEIVAQVPKDRQTLAYVRSFYRGIGEAYAIQGNSADTVMLLGRPLWMWRAVVERELVYRFKRTFLGRDRSMQSLVDASLAWGGLRGGASKIR